MYNELYAIWKRELESIELEKLPSDFYSMIAEYLKRLKEESRMLDKRTVKASLLKKEMQNVKYMVRVLVRTRYNKLVRKVARGQKVPLDVLTIAEQEIYTRVSPFAEIYQRFAEGIFSGYVPKFGVKQVGKRAVVRFLEAVPAIIGSDMKTYGPFKAEDIASLPIENAKILVKQGLSEKIEI